MDYLLNMYKEKLDDLKNLLVLNLIINGLPSKLKLKEWIILLLESFKPYYKWITF